MNKALNVCFALIWRKLGHCWYCMRRAFQVALLAWLILTVLFVLTVPKAVLEVGAGLAISLTFLWLCHMAVYAAKVSAGHRFHDVQIARSGEALEVNEPRRKAVKVFLHQLVFVALGTTVPGLVLADSCVCYCGGRSWGPGTTACFGGFKYHCVDAAPGTNCGWDPIAGQPRCDGAENCS